MRYFIAAILLSLALTATAQLKYDANWVFGYNAGIDFNDPQNPVNFTTYNNNIEYAGAISDSKGRLLFYVSNMGDPNSNYACIRDRNNQKIIGSDSLFINVSCTNAVSIVPSLTDTSVYWIMHMGQANNHINCPSSSLVCFQLYISKIIRTASDSLIIKKKNILASSFLTGESLAITKDRFAQAWWVIVHGNFSCSNRYHKYLLSDTLDYFGYQDIGKPNCHQFNAGEMTFSLNGDKLLRVCNGDHFIELVNFDRCTRQLSNAVLLDSTIGEVYGSSLSPSGELAYVSTVDDNPQTGFNKGIYQYYIGSNNSQVTRYTVWDTTSNSGTVPFQMELAPNGSIYVTLTRSGTFLYPLSNFFPYYLNLSVIKSPDSIGPNCRFEGASFRLGDSSRVSFGLPHSPNYNLEPIGPFRMSAGADKVICTNDTSQHGVTIGSPVVAGITYQWISEEIDSADRGFAQITVNPDSTTLYYIQITDSSYSGSCTNSYIDSVLVEVKECQLVGINETPFSNITLYPNPATDQLYINLPDNIPTAQLELYSLLGAKLLQSPVHDKTPINISQLPKGMYVYRVRVGGSIHNGKLLIE